MKRKREDSVNHNTLMVPTHDARDDDPSNADSETAEESWSIGGLNELRPAGRTFHFALDFNVFNDLVEATYRHLCDANLEYSKNVSMGMFSYYCGVSLWYRLYAVKYAQGGDQSWWFPSLKLAISCKLVLPRVIAKFLDMIGDFYEPNSGFYWKLAFTDFNTDGHFGEMSADSFYKYMAYPAPAILIATLQQELNDISRKENSYSQWKLDKISYENCPEARVFTKNVCGYYVPLQASVYDILINDPIGEQLSAALKNLKGSEAGWLWWTCPKLFAHISGYNKNEMKGYPMTEYANESKYGSPVQMGFVEFSNDLEVDNASSISVRGFSPFPIPGGQSNLIPVFRLRAKRASVINAYPYDFPSLDDIPAGWAEKLNINFEYGDARNRWNLGVYTTDCVDAKLAVTDYVRIF